MPESIRARLFSLQDTAYGDFTAALMPTVPRETVIGVRMPALRQLARALRGTPEAAAFLQQLPHAFYEENNLHAFLLEGIRDFEACLAAVNRFLPLVDNWATCDCMNPAAFKKAPERLLPEIEKWLHSGKTYVIRFGIGMLMRHFLDERFHMKYLYQVSSIDGQDYYVRMMIAWYFATALAKQYDATLPLLQQRVLPAWTHNKAIQKAIESRRITPAQKDVLRALKVR